MKKCVVFEYENGKLFEEEVNKRLEEGYRIEASSCNHRTYRAIMVLDDEDEKCVQK